MIDVYIGVGSNLDEPMKQVTLALNKLCAHPDTECVQVSSMYKTPPLDGSDQPDYVNAVCYLRTELDAESLLDELQRLENEQGRLRSNKRWQARTIDLDILLYGSQVINSERLNVPHPGMSERAFVLVPLADIVPDNFIIPGHASLRVLLDAVSDSTISLCTPSNPWDDVDS